MLISYEGEGPNLGLKTVFYNYPEEALPFEIPSGIPAAYVNAEEIDSSLERWIRHHRQSSKITVEADACQARPDMESGGLYFLRCGSADDLKGWRFRPDVFAKVRVFVFETLNQCVGIANSLGAEGWPVLLMPEFESDGLGQMMLNQIQDIHHNVRFMPPVHKLLGIP